MYSTSIREALELACVRVEHLTSASSTVVYVHHIIYKGTNSAKQVVKSTVDLVCRYGKLQI